MNDNFPAPSYFEAHVEIDDVLAQESSRVALFKKDAALFEFRVAKLQMVKGNEVVNFCTGHGQDYKLLLGRMNALCECLAVDKFIVRRFKIEAVVFDSRNGDTF